jgi:hypothetical protein
MYAPRKWRLSRYGNELGTTLLPVGRALLVCAATLIPTEQIAAQAGEIPPLYEGPGV